MEFKTGFYKTSAGEQSGEFNGDFIWLDYHNFTTIARSWYPYSPAYAGAYRRNGSSSYVDEILIQFNNLPTGVTVHTAAIEVTADAQGPQNVATLMSLYKQDKTAPASWSNPPRYDDFCLEHWDYTVDSITGVKDSGVYTFDGGGVKSIVQQWIDNPSSNWGLIVHVDFNYHGWWLRFNHIKLLLTY